MAFCGLELMYLTLKLPSDHHPRNPHPWILGRSVEVRRAWCHIDCRSSPITHRAQRICAVLVVKAPNPRR